MNYLNINVREKLKKTKNKKKVIKRTEEKKMVLVEDNKNIQNVWSKLREKKYFF